MTGDSTSHFTDRELDARAERLASGFACHSCFPSTGKNSWSGKWIIRLENRLLILCTGFKCELGHECQAREVLASKQPTQWKTRTKEAHRGVRGRTPAVRRPGR